MRVVRRCGFTLLELLVGLTIVIILTVAAVPVFVNLYQEYHLTTTIQNLYYALQYARSTAVQKNQTVYVNFQSGDTWCYGINLSTNCNCSLANNCTLANYSAARAQDMTLSTTGLVSNSISFEGSHGASISSSTMTFTLYGQSLAITLKVSPLGNLTICSANIAGYPSCS